MASIGVEVLDAVVAWAWKARIMGTGSGALLFLHSERQVR